MPVILCSVLLCTFCYLIGRMISMQKIFSVTASLVLILACTQQRFRSGSYSNDSSENAPLTLPSIELNVTGDEIVTGRWKSLQEPKSGKIVSAANIFKVHSFSIYLPECKKDLPVALEQLGNDLEVEMKALPACGVAAQRYLLHSHQ